MQTNTYNFSRIGLGCVTFGREIDRVAAFSMMDHAVSNGINHFDTAAVYGAGASEKITGEWLQSRKPGTGSLFIATKVLPPYNTESIVSSVEASRKRLGLDCIDLLYLHNWHDSALDSKTLETLESLVQRRVIGGIGASNFTAGQLEQVIRLQQQHGFMPVRFVQSNHNLAVSDCSPALQQLCMQQAIGIITYSPLGAGYLTGKYLSSIQAGTRFDRIKGHQEIYFTVAAAKRLDRLLSVAEKTGYDPALLALAWALQQSVCSVLVGGRNVEQLDKAFQALDFSDKAILATLTE